MLMFGRGTCQKKEKRMRIVVTPFAIRCAGVSKHQRVRVATSQPASDDVWQGSSPSHTFSILDCYIRTMSFPNGYNIDPRH